MEVKGKEKENREKMLGFEHPRMPLIHSQQFT